MIQSKIIGQIYDVILGGEEWSAPLNEIADYCGMENTALVLVDNRLASASVIAPRADPEIITAYNGKWWECDPTVKATRLAQVGQLTSLTDTGREEFLHSDFHQEFWSRSGLGAERIATNLALSDGAFVSCVLQASVQHDEVDHSTFQRFASFVPHLIRATTIQRKIQRLTVENALLGATEADAALATLIVDADGRLIFSDEPGERMLATSNRIGLRQGRIRLSERDANARLWRAVTMTCGAYSDLSVNSPVCMPLGDRTIVIDVMPFVSKLHNTGPFCSRPAALLRIREVSKEKTSLPEPTERRISPERRKETTAPSAVVERESLLTAVKRDIRQNLGDSMLSLTWLAKRHGVSSRVIRNLFYAEGTNFTDWLINIRLDHAKDMLANPHHEHTNIVTIAFESGFGDLSWFHHAFRRRFGVTPAQMRAKG